MKKLIDKFLLEKESVSLPLIPISHILIYFDKLGYTQKKFETNGYQVDWWLQLEKNNCKDILISGGLFYNENILVSYADSDD